jgi:hypothetical protein
MSGKGQAAARAGTSGAGAGDVFVSLGMDVTVERVDRDEPFRDSVSPSRAVGQTVAHVVRTSEAAGRIPIVLAGSCDASIGILAGSLDRCQTAVRQTACPRLAKCCQ